jgi:hypothetical protein
LFTEAEERAMQIAADFAPHIPRQVIERLVLGLRSQALENEMDGLLQALESMNPEMGARALRESARRAEELANDLEDHLRRTNNEPTS